MKDTTAAGHSRPPSVSEHTELISETAITKAPSPNNPEEMGISSKSTPVMAGKKLKVQPSKDADLLDKLGEELRLAIWPFYDHDKFTQTLEEWPELLELKDGGKQETLLHRACRYGNKKIVVSLLAKGASPCVRNAKGATPLHLACQFKQMDIVKMLIEKGAPIEEKDDLGDQPIHSAAKSGCMGCLGLLHENGAFFCSKGHLDNTVIHYAAKKGRLQLIDTLLQKGGDLVNLENALKETPLHLACSHYTKENNGNVDLIERLLDGGARLEARTAWGDTAIHYAARWGTDKVMGFLIDEGVPLDRPEIEVSQEFWDKHGIDAAQVKEYKLSLLQKTAKSSCIIKNNLMIERIMQVRNIGAQNMYFGNNGTGEEDIIEMNNSQLQLAALSTEFYNSIRSGDQESTMQMLMKYCPDSLPHLFDLCVTKPCMEQVQGRTYFDFFLFMPSQINEETKSGTEMKFIDDLITYGKEKYLIHPLIEVFLKLKWFKSKWFYLFFILLNAIFLVALSGFAIAHLGNLYKGVPRFEPHERSGWWYFLAVCHSYVSLMALSKTYQVFKIVFKMFQDSQSTESMGRKDLFIKLGETIWNALKHGAIPALSGLVLYAPLNESNMRYCLAVCIILTSQMFMNILSRVPGVGLYVHMLHKVALTVLNFFLTYIFTFLGYAIAFHLILPQDGAFGTFIDATIKVFTMVMGEYEFTLNFINVEEQSYVAKLIFVVFVFDMSVALMNLVLGLAVSDIDELQRNSAVRRMIQESYTVMYIDGFMTSLATFSKCMTCLDRRITGPRTCGFKDVYFLDLVDLDPNSNNKLGVEVYMKGTEYFPSTHAIVTNIAKIVGERILATRAKEEEDKSQFSTEFSAIDAKLALLMGEMTQVKKSLMTLEDKRQKK